MVAATVPAGYNEDSVAGLDLDLAAAAGRPAGLGYATNAETISGRDGELMPLRTYQEFFAAAVNPKARLTAGVNLQGPPSGGGRRWT